MARSPGAPPRYPGGATYDDGFSLVEVVVALVLIVVVMTATAGFFVRGMATTRLMQQRQSAVAAAEQAMERARGLSPATLAAHDTTETGATTQDYRVANIDYTVRTVATPCGLIPGGGSCAGDPADPANMLMYRIKVDVTWKPRAGVRCPGSHGLCEYSVTTLRDPSPRSVQRLKEVPAVTL